MIFIKANVENVCDLCGPQIPLLLFTLANWGIEHAAEQKYRACLLFGTDHPINLSADSFI